MDVIEQENLVENAKAIGDYLLEELKKFPQIKEDARTRTNDRASNLKNRLRNYAAVSSMTSMYLPEQAARMYFACYLLSVSAWGKRKSSSPGSKKYSNRSFD